MLMNATVTVTTVPMGLVLMYKALIFVSALLATPSTLIADNVLVNLNITKVVKCVHVLANTDNIITCTQINYVLFYLFRC